MFPMSNVISTRLNEEEIQELNDICESEHLDRSTLVRQFILRQLLEYRLKEAGEKYRKGLVSLAEAATLARASIYTMMEYTERENLHPPEPTREEILEQARLAEHLLPDKDNE